MTNHRDCDHPATKAGRAACRDMTRASQTHTYAREDRDDAVRMHCSCGATSAWGTFAQTSAAQDAHCNRYPKGI